MYLAEKTGRFLPKTFRAREIARQWLVWQVAGLGPMHGQANHFLRYALPGQEYASHRYLKEALRLMTVLEGRLSEVEFLAGECSIADMACWSYASIVHTIGIEIEDYPPVARWRATIEDRQAVRRVRAGRLTATPAEFLRPVMKLSPDQWSNMFGDRMHAAVRLGSAAETQS